MNDVDDRPVMWDCSACGASFDVDEMLEITLTSPIDHRRGAVVLTCPVCKAQGQFEGPRR